MSSTLDPDVFLSLLALDAYNRGYGQNVGGLPSTGWIGQAEIVSQSNFASGSDEVNAGFYGIAYNWQGQTVFSYRGTNIENGLPQSDDVFNGWSLGAGFSSSSQGQLAVKFYEAVSGVDSIYDYNAGTAIFTGHSLGGGLAGYVGALSHGDSFGFDHMPFLNAAWGQAISEAASRALQAASAEFGSTVTIDELAAAALLGTVSDLYDAAIVFRDTFVDEWNIVKPKTDTMSGYYLEGEFLAAVRLADESLNGIDLTSLFDLSLGYPIGGLLTEGVYSEDVVQKTKISNRDVDLGPIGLHSQSLLTTTLFGERQWVSEGGGNQWEQSAKYIFPSLNSDTIGVQIGLGSYPGEDGPGGKMASMIAYSAINEGARIFGDTGIRALFNDADELGRQLTRASNALSTETLDLIGATIAEFSGLLAVNKILEESSPEALAGVIAIGDSSPALLVIVDDQYWSRFDQADSDYVTVNGGLLISRLLDENIGSFLDSARITFSTWLRDVSGSSLLTSSAELIDVISMVFSGNTLYRKVEGQDPNGFQFFLGLDTDYSDGNSGGYSNTLLSSNDIVISGDGGNQFLGIGGDDALITGAGVDVLDGGSGDDLIAGGGNGDTLNGGDGNDRIYNGDLDGEDDDAADTLTGGAGNDTFYVGDGDTIVDPEGGDTIFLRGVRLTGGEETEEDSRVYVSPDGGTYILSDDGSLTFSINPTIRVLNFTNGKAGIRLVDKEPETDKAEERRDPLIIDLDGDRNVVRERFDSFAYFDLDNDGFAEHVAWSLPEDGFLVRDLNGNGSIDNGTEMFGGGRTEVDAGELGREGTAGFDELGVLDSNADGIISAADADFESLRVWVDANGDARTDVGELKLLSDLGIVSISLDILKSNDLDSGLDGTQITRASSVVYEGGSTGFVYDAYLSIDQYDAREIIDDDLDLTVVADLPVLLGTGKLSDLSVAMARDPGLEQMVRELTELTSADAGQFHERVQQIIMRWTGADQIATDSRGDAINARWLHAIEMISGSDFNQAVIGPNPRADAASVIIGEWNTLLERVSSKLLGQVALGQEILPGLSFEAGAFFTVAEGVTLASVLTQAAAVSPEDRGENLQYWKAVVSALAQYQEAFGVNGSNYAIAINAALVADGLPGIGYQELRDSLFVGNASRDGLDSVEFSSEFIANRLLVATAGTESLSGGAGNDRYILAEVAGSVSINDTIGTDVLELWGWDAAETGVTLDVLGSEGSGFDGPASGSIRFNLSHADQQVGFLIQLSDGEISAPIETLVFDDGETLDIVDLLSLGGAVALGGNTTVVFGQAMADFDMIGDGSANYLLGRGISDRYYLTAASGQDYLIDGRDLLSNGDELHIDALQGDVTFALGGDWRENLVVSLNASDSLMVVGRQFTDPAYAIEWFVFADGTRVAASEVKSSLVTGTVASETIEGTYADDVIDGLGGADILLGGHGNDRYVVHAGYGKTVIDDAAGISTVAFDPGLTLEDLDIGFVGDDLRVTIEGTDTSVLIRSGAGLAGTVLEIDGQLTSVTGFLVAGALRVGTSVDGTIFGSAADDELFGGDDPELLIGAGGNDRLNGGLGNDSYLISAGNISIYDEGFGYDSLVADERFTLADLSFEEGPFQEFLIVLGDYEAVVDLSNESPSGPTHDARGGDVEQIVFSDGSALQLTNGHQIAGTVGDDILFTYASNAETFTPGAGNDRIFGFNGWHNLELDQGFGHDEFTSDDRWTITFNGIALDDQVSFVRDGYDLVINVDGGNDSLTVNHVFEPLSSINSRNLVFSNQTLSLSDLVSTMAVTTNGDDLIYGQILLNGGLGDDVMIGTSIDNLYIFGRGFGHDVIKEQDSTYGSDDDENDTLFLQDLLPGDVSFARHSTDPLSVVLTINDTGETLTLDGTPFDGFRRNFDKLAGGDPDGGDQYGTHWIERIVFSDDTEISQRDIEQQMLDAESTDGNDILVSFGAPFFVGVGPGAIANGGAGDDTYVAYHRALNVSFTPDGGQDAVEDRGGLLDQVIVNFSGFALDQIAQFVELRDGREVTVVRGNDGTELVVPGTPNVMFRDETGTFFGHTSIDGGLVPNNLATDQTDFLTGELGDKIGSDYPYYPGINETYEPGRGDDHVFGRGGSETILFNFGDGLDTLYAIPADQLGSPAGPAFDPTTYQVVLGEGFDADDLGITWLSDGTNRVQIDFNDVGDGVVVDAEAISSISYANGTHVVFGAQSGQGGVPLLPGETHYNDGGWNETLIAQLGDVQAVLSPNSGKDTLIDASLSQNPFVPSGWLSSTLGLFGETSLDDFEFVRDLANPSDLLVRNLSTDSSIRIVGQFTAETAIANGGWLSPSTGPDGEPDWAKLDLDGNGVADFAVLDTDGDGQLDWQSPDFDGDGVADWDSALELSLDADGDGRNDVFGYDDNGDGIADGFYLFAQDIYLFDQDGDNIPDAYGNDIALPTKPDGSVDWAGLDVDQDGTSDTAFMDFDGDGTPDWESPDHDGDGISDWVVGVSSNVQVPGEPIQYSRGAGRLVGETLYILDMPNFSLLLRDEDSDGVPETWGMDIDFDLQPDIPLSNYVVGEVQHVVQLPDGSFEQQIYNWSEIAGRVIERVETDGASTGEIISIDLDAIRPGPSTEDDILYVGAGQSIDGLGGRDVIIANEGQATITAGIGRGQVTLIGEPSSQYADQDNTVFLSGVSVLSELQVQFVAGKPEDLVIRVLATGEQLHIVGQLYRDGNNNADPVVSNFVLEGGQEVSWQAIATMAAGYADLGGTTIIGSDDGSVLNGGSGNDLLLGGAANDVYDFGLGYDEDRIQDTGGADLLRFSAGIGLEGIHFSRVGIGGADLLVEVTGLERLAVTIAGQFVSEDARIERLEFADGSAIGWQQIQAIILDQEKTSGDDDIDGFLTSDLVEGGAGNDNLFGDKGDDLILGGSGRDTAIFRGSQAEYAVTTVEGRTIVTDLIAGRDGTDTLEGVEDIAFLSDASLLSLTALNTAPVAGALAATTLEDTVLVIARSDLAQLASDADGDTLSWGVLSSFDYGFAWFDTLGNVRFRPDADFAGQGGFSYSVIDGNGGEATGRVTVDVTGVNDAPRISGVPASIVVAEDDPIDFQLPPAAVRDSDGDTLNVVMQLADGSPLPDWLQFDGSRLTGQPPTNFVGTLTLLLRADDGTATSTAPIALEILPINDAPVADGNVPDQVIRGGESFAFSISTAAFIDPDGDPLNFAMVLADGSALPDWIVSDGLNVSGMAPVDFEGPLSLVLIADDGRQSGFATFDLVSLANAPPVVTNPVGTLVSPEDQPFSLSLPADMFDDPDSDTLLITAALSDGSPLPAWLGFDGVSFTGMPPQNFNGSLVISVMASDGELSVSEAVTFTIEPVNDDPLAAGDAYSVDEDSSLTVTAMGVLINDSDVDGDTLTAFLVSDVSNGTLTLNMDGNFTYTPDSNFNGSDSFVYAAYDGSANSNAMTVNLTVSPVNDNPDAVDDSGFSTDYQTPLDIVTSTLLANDSDIDGNSLVVTSVQGATNGVVVLNGATVTFTPTNGYDGPASFTYTINDGNGGEGTATVTLAVNATQGGNSGPVGVPDFYGVNEDEELAVAAGGVLINDIDEEGNSLTAVLVNGPSNGALNFNSDGSFTYMPYADFNGSDLFSYRANDGALDGNITNVSITVNPTNDSPDAANDGAYNVGYNQSNDFLAATLLGNDADPDGDALFVTSVQDAVNGSVVLNGTVVSFTPATDYTGAASFTYTISDGNGGEDTATVNMYVLNPPPPPPTPADPPTDGDDIIYATSQNEAFDGLGGFDVVSYQGVGGSVTARLQTDLPQDTGAGGVDSFANIEGLAGSRLNDMLYGNDAENLLRGDQGADFLSGLGGNDTITGDAGNDTIDGGAGDDKMGGGSGVDTISYLTNTEGVIVSLALTGYQDTGSSGFDQIVQFENLTGSRGNDVLTGDENENIISGAQGNDIILGAGGDDKLFGDFGDDIVNGGSGIDQLGGGHGADIFVFDSLDGDIIKDFDSTDSIDVSAFSRASVSILQQYGRSFVYFDTDQDGQFNDGYFVVQGSGFDQSDLMF